MLCALVVTILMLFAAAPASATTIYYTPTKTGGIVSPTTWSTEFQVVGHTFASNELLAIFFPFDSYSSDILDITAPDPNWTIQIFEPGLVLGLPEDGEVDLIPSTDGLTAPNVFLTYTYLAGDPYPVPQDWQILDTDTFSVLDSGLTTAVPEPATTLMLGGGLAFAWILRKRRNSSNRAVTVRERFLNQTNQSGQRSV